MNTKPMISVLLIVLTLFLIGTGVYTVREGQRALVLRLGELVINPKTQRPEVVLPGLHFKLPIVTKVRKLDVRIQTLDVDSSRILTAEQKYVIVDYFAKWRIKDVALYYKRTGGLVYRTRMLLRQKTNDALRAAFGKRTIKEVISGDRVSIMKILKQRADESARSLGVQVIDLRIKGIDLPAEVRDSVFQRMSTEREQVATKHRSQGKAQAEALRANADATVTVMLANAKAAAQKIRASGDAKAANVYIKAYRKNPKFYSFYRSLRAYNQVFKSKSTIMVIKPNGRFFKYFSQSLAKK
jgi:modulator of FtsH protease HflC